MQKTNFAAVVGKHFPQARLVQVQRLAGGVSADVFRLDLNNARAPQTVVLRIHGETHSGHDATLEFELLAALHEAGIPVARPMAVDTSAEILEAPYLLIAFVDGTTRVPEGREKDCIALMANWLAQFHSEPPNNLPELPVRNDPLPALFDYMPEGDEWRALTAYLGTLSNTGFNGAPALLHGDFWPENILWKNGQIEAILDWEDAAIGDPLSDVACCALELRYVHDVAGAEHFLRCYAKRRPLDGRRFALWQIYVASAAQKFMSQWGLPAEKEAHMRRTALQTIREAGASLMATA